MLVKRSPGATFRERQHLPVSNVTVRHDRVLSFTDKGGGVRRYCVALSWTIPQYWALYHIRIEDDEAHLEKSSFTDSLGLIGDVERAAVQVVVTTCRLRIEPEDDQTKSWEVHNIVAGASAWQRYS